MSHSVIPSPLAAVSLLGPPSPLPTSDAIDELQCGTLPVYDWKPTCHIIAEEWPTWLSVAQSLGLSCSSVSVSTLRYHDVWLAFNSEVTWSRSFAIEPGRSDLLCISGSLSFVEPLWSLYSASHVLWVALDVSVAPSPSMLAQGSWIHASHASVGGVTSGEWWIGVSSTVPNFASPFQLLSARRVGHFLSGTGSGVACPPPLALTDQLSPASFFPLSSPASLFVCNSVFSPTGWVSRPLSLVEIGRVCDLPDSVAQAYASRWGVVSCATPFLVSAPQKLLYAAGLRCRPFVRGGLKGLVNGLAQPTVAPGCWSTAFPTLDTAPAIYAPLLSQSTSDAPVDDLGRAKAAKADDAPVDTDQWDVQIWSKFPLSCIEQGLCFLSKQGHSPLATIRHWLLRRWRRNVWTSLRRFMVAQHGVNWATFDSSLDSDRLVERAASVECLQKAMAADWWDWLEGSRLFFWRWPAESRRWAMQGLPVWLLRTPIPYRKPQRAEPDPIVQEQVGGKLERFRGRGYIAPGEVLGLISYFIVPKGETDVRVVFDATKSGLNECIWCPSFGLPTIENLLEALEPGTWQADIDLGEMFYNFMLDPAIVPYSGVDLTPYLGHGKRMNWEPWLRCIMGLKPSPYGCIRMELLHSEVTVGLHRAAGNPFYYDYVRLNLPGDPAYDPRLPRVSKVIESTGRIAGAVHTYVDDKRCSGFSEDHCVAVTRRVASGANYLGVQDAPRKRVWPSLRAGAWTGSVAHTDQGKVTVLSTQEKWDKARAFVLDMETVVASGGVFDYKTLERQRGFLIYVIRTYPSLKPYLKGIHLTVDSWRPGRDAEGWKCDNVMREHYAAKSGDDEAFTLESHPKTVRAVPRLAGDLVGLRRLLSSPTPPRRVVRSDRVIVVYYGFADASGGGFGSTVAGPSGIRYRYGLWGESCSGKSSNYRELRNVVEAVQDQAQESFPQLKRMLDAVDKDCVTGEWQGVEFYLFTDNAVAEGAFYKGTSSNRALFELVLRLRELELHHSLALHVTHVSGRRMIAQGTDGLSRGDFSDGVMRGKSMGEFIPLHKSALELSAGLLEWCQSWCPPHLPLLALSPNDWFWRGHGLLGGHVNPDGVWTPEPLTELNNILLWSPPPAAADSALEQLGLSRHKRPHLAHLFQDDCQPFGAPAVLSLLLLEFLFLTQLLTLGVSAVVPGFWNWKGNCVGCGKKRHGTNGLFCANFGAQRGSPFKTCTNVWCGECYTPHPLDKFHIQVPRDESGFEWLANPRDALRFRSARDGDHLVTPFQCDHCLFVMLTNRTPLAHNRQDDMLQCCIRRANLDAFWGRESSTVLANRRNLNQLLALWDTKVGIPPNALPPLGPYPNHDLFGVSVAVGMLLKSLQPGRYKDYCQFETIRKLRSAYSNVYHASVESAYNSMTLGRDTAKAFLTSCPTQSMWFERFVKGLLRRMGQEVRQDLAISIPVMLALQALLEEEWQSGSPLLRATATYVGAYSLSAFGAALRGHEVFLVDLHGLHKYMQEHLVCNGQPYVLLPLLGRFKSEDGERYHLTPLAAQSASGLNFKLWLSRLVDLRQAQGASHGPAFAVARGVPLSSQWLEQELLDRLFRIQAKPADSPVIGTHVNVYEEYGISRSFRRGATTEAKNRQVPGEDIDIVNRWRNEENAAGARPRLRMQDHYADITLLLQSHLRFSSAL